jgi:hypothetical protein
LFPTLGDPVCSHPGSALSLGSVGTRRTVYLSDDDPPASSSNKVTPPLLVYNRISTVIGEPQRQPNTVNNVCEETNMQDVSSTDRKKSENTKENAIWYEYGCV